MIVSRKPYILRVGILALLSVSLAQENDSHSDLDSLINEIFGQDEGSNSVSDAKCEPIVGEPGPGCFECYNCGHEALAGRTPGDIKRLTLNSESCDKGKEVCCVSQAVVFASRTGGACGRSNPDGAGARRWKKPTEVLLGEYPWTAAVYKKPEWQYACGAVLVSMGALLATARCVSGARADQLLVKIGADGAGSVELPVEGVITHEGFDSDKGYNDVALLRLSARTQKLLPSWAAPACLPTAAPLPAIACVTVTRNNRASNSVVLRRRLCGELLQQGGAARRLHASLLCSAANTLEAPAPDHGAPLLCQDATSPEWVAYGLASDRGSLERGVHLHTNLAHFTDWTVHNLQ